MTIGQPLDQAREQFKNLPNEVLIKYRSDPNADVGGLPVSLLAGMELARRAAFQSQAAQQAAANTPPTVVDGAAQTLGLAPPPAAPAVPGQPPAVPGQPPVAPGGIAGVPAQPPAAPQEMQQAPAPQAPQPAPQAPQPAPGFSSGGAVAFAEGGTTPSTDVQIEQELRRQLESDKAVAEAANDPVKVAEITAKLSGITNPRYSAPAGAMQPAASPQAPQNPQALLEMLRTQGPAQKAYAELLKAHQGHLENYKPGTLTDEQRSEMLQREFEKNQAISKPYYDKQSQLLEEERKSATSGDPANSALLRMGLSMMGGRGNLASIIGQSGLGALDYYGKAQQEQAAALREARKGEMGLIRSRMADERGDRTSAQSYVTDAERRALSAQSADDARRAGLLGISERNASAEDRERLAIAQRIEEMRRNQEREAQRREDLAAQERRHQETIANRVAIAGIQAGKGSGNNDVRNKAKFIEDSVGEVDKQIAKAKETLTDIRIPETVKAQIRAELAGLEGQRNQLRKAWGDLVGVPMTPTTPSTAGRTIDFGAIK